MDESGVRASLFPNGAVLARRFVIRERLPWDEGGIGTVYAAYDRRGRRVVALKVVPADGAATSARAAQAFGDTSALLNLRDPSLVRVEEVLDDAANGVVLLVSELVDGETLREMLLAARRERSRVHWPDARRLSLELLGALERLHGSGLAHQNLRPETIHIDAAGRVRLRGLALARMLTRVRLVSQAVAMGAAAYLPPEVRRRPEQAVDVAVWQRADVFAAGVVLYEVLMGALPCGPLAPVSELRPDLPRGIEQLLHRAMAADPGERFASAAEMAAAVRRLGPSNPSGERRAAMVPAARRKGRPVLLGIGLLSVGGVFLLASVFSSAPPPGGPTTVEQPGLHTAPAGDGLVRVRSDATEEDPADRRARPPVNDHTEITSDDDDPAEHPR